jgi:hypothetical protein
MNAPVRPQDGAGFAVERRKIPSRPRPLGWFI